MSQRPLSRKEATHQRIVEAAARAIRRSGYDGTGVADIMKEAGLTHGGFYAHFASRDALLAEAVRWAGRDSAARLQHGTQLRQTRGASALRALIEGYLGDAHLVAAEAGCVVAALCSEMSRQAPEVRAASGERVQGLIERVRDALPAHAAGSPAAMTIASTMVGALQLARAQPDPRQAKAMLKSVREELLARYDTD